MMPSSTQQYIELSDAHVVKFNKFMQLWLYFLFGHSYIGACESNVALFWLFHAAYNDNGTSPNVKFPLELNAL